MAGSTFKKLAVSHNAASVAAGSDILTAVTLKQNGVLMVTVAVDTSTTVQLGIDDGATQENLDLNGGAALSASVVYVFTVPGIATYAYSLVNKDGATATTIAHASFMQEVPVG